MSHILQVKSSSKSSEQIRILLVEGEGHFGRLYQQILSEASYNVLLVSTGEEALIQLSNDRFDVVLADYQLPNMRGDQLVKTLRLSQSGVCTIFISAYPDIAKRARRCGADAYYAKWEPFSSLLANIRGLVSDSQKAAPRMCQVGERSM